MREIASRLWGALILDRRVEIERRAADHERDQVLHVISEAAARDRGPTSPSGGAGGGAGGTGED